MFEEDRSTDRVFEILRGSEQSWETVTLEQVSRAIAALTAERRKLRPRSSARLSEKAAMRLTQSGEELRTLIKVNADKWAERGEPALLKKIGEQLENMTSASRNQNPYDEIVLRALELAYEELTGKKWDSR